MERAIFPELQSWAAEKKRKVLLIRGARQVGKTFIVRELGKDFEHFLEVNFLDDPVVASFFEQDLNPSRICRDLSAYYGIPVIPGKTVVFFDEIQECPLAITALRFFYEKLPEQHVIAAGSLLEFALESIASFGVGRIQSCFMYPLSFPEFVRAIGGKASQERLDDASPKAPLPEALHQKYLEWFRIFLFIGGMPEVVETYLEHQDWLRCERSLETLIVSFEDDFPKYQKTVSSELLQGTLEAVVHQVGNKFKYSHVAEGTRTEVLKNAFHLLVKAGLVHPIHHTSAQGLPLGAQKNEKKFKAILLDTGLHQRFLKLPLANYVIEKDFHAINKGNLAEVFVGNELLKAQSCYSSQKLYYWHREQRGSLAEVDYVIQQGEEVIPVEVKAGNPRRSKSLGVFLQEHRRDRGILLSTANFSQTDELSHIPLYAAYQLIQN